MSNPHVDAIDISAVGHDVFPRQFYRLTHPSLPAKPIRLYPQKIQGPTAVACVESVSAIWLAISDGRDIVVSAEALASAFFADAAAIEHNWAVLKARFSDEGQKIVIVAAKGLNLLPNRPVLVIRAADRAPSRHVGQ